MGESSYRRFLNNGSPSISEIFHGYQPPTFSSPTATPLDMTAVVRPTSSRNLSVLPSRLDFSDQLISAVRPYPRCLARTIADNFQDEGLIIIDCAPTESIFTQAAYHASRYLLVPVRPEFFATIGFPLLNDSLEDFRGKNKGHQIDVLGIVINDAIYRGSNEGGPERRRAMDEIRVEARKSGWPIFNTEITYSRGFPKLMRGDTNHLGDSKRVMGRFADELFNRPELVQLGLGRSP